VEHGQRHKAYLRGPYASVSKFLCCRPRTVPEVAEVRDIQLPGAAGPMRARIYNPTPNASAPQPALIYIHGGGWCLSSVESHDSICRALASQANIVVLSLDYRLAPEHVFPAGLEDCYAATQWISKHANELNLDPARLAMGEQTALCSSFCAVCILPLLPNSVASLVPGAQAKHEKVSECITGKSACC